MYAKSVENYIESLKIASKCSGEDLNEIIKTSDAATQKDLLKLKKFIEYSKTPESKRYYNIHETININEDSISHLYAWLLDLSQIPNQNGKLDTNDIRYKFFTKYMEKIRVKTLPNLENIGCLPNADGKDIILSTKNSDDFVCVIENKKAADISVDTITFRTQIERYVDDFNNFKNKKFVFICAHEQFLTDCKVFNHISTRGVAKDLVKIGDNYLDKEITIAQLLEKFGYITLEHSEIALILYEILKEECKERFDNSILKSATYQEMINLLEKLKKYCGNNEPKIQELIEKSEELSAQDYQFFTYFPCIKNDLGIEIKANSKINFYKALSGLEYRDVLEILCKFVEYWEMHTGTGDGVDMCGSKIIDGKCINQICHDIRKTTVYENLPDNIKSVAEKLDWE